MNTVRVGILQAPQRDMNETATHPHVDAAATTKTKIQVRDLLRPGRVMTVSLAAGVVLLTATTWGLLPTSDHPATRPPAGFSEIVVMPTVLMGFGTAAVAGVIALLVQRSMIKAAGKRLRSGRVRLKMPTPHDFTVIGKVAEFFSHANTATLVSQLIFEGAAIVNCVLLFVDQQWIHLIPIAACVLAAVLDYPTLSKRITQIEQVVYDKD